MPKLTIDGVEIEAAEGQSVLEAALANGIHIPHFCFHPLLKVGGNCRMCLIEIEKVPKLQIACGTAVRDGMVVFTKTDRVTNARRGVLEFMLINHPLDCPVCDQAGECKLQDYCFKYGMERSRFIEEKHTFEHQDLGPWLSKDMNRCLHCTRCIRFMRDIAGSEELTLHERGNDTVVGPYLETSIENEFCLNLVDICPVGALTSKPFRFQARSWLMEKTRTLCAGCSRGCNVIAWTYKGRLLRLTPAENAHVNQCWLCNPGRMSFESLYAKNRLTTAMESMTDTDIVSALDTAAGKLKSVPGEKTAVIASRFLTIEDNYLICRFARDVLNTEKVAFVSGPEDDSEFGPSKAPLPDWFMREDLSPNSTGAAHVLNAFGYDLKPATLIEEIENGEIRALVVFGDNFAASMGDVSRVKSAANRLSFVMVTDSHSSTTTDMASVFIPESTFAEKDGTYTNEGGRVQKLKAALRPQNDCRSAWQTVQELASRLGVKWNYTSASQIFDEMAAVVPEYEGMSFSDIPDEGIQTTKEPEPEDATAGTGDNGENVKTADGNAEEAD